MHFGYAKSFLIFHYSKYLYYYTYKYASISLNVLCTLYTFVLCYTLLWQLFTRMRKKLANVLLKEWKMSIRPFLIEIPTEAHKHAVEHKQYKRIKFIVKIKCTICWKMKYSAQKLHKVCVFTIDWDWEKLKTRCNTHRLNRNLENLTQLYFSCAMCISQGSKYHFFEVRDSPAQPSLVSSPDFGGVQTKQA